MHEITSWSEEMRAAYLYRVVAQAEAGTPREKLFLELAGEAEGQAAIWADKARAVGATLPEFVPDMRARVVAGLVRTHGPRKLRTVLAAMKVRGMSVYALSLIHISEPTAACRVVAICALRCSASTTA